MISSITLRNYQQAAVEGVMAAHAAGEKGALVVHATGTGKTFVAAAVAEKFAARKQRTLILADLGELLGQAGKALDHFGLKYSVEKSDERAHVGNLFDDVVLASVQTMRGNRLERWPKDYFGLVIADEAHVFMAETYRKTIEHFNAFRLGMTATPERGDGQKLGILFPVLAHEYSLQQAVHDNNLCRLRIVRPTTNVDLSAIRTTAGDLNAGDLEDEISQHIEELVNSFKAEIGDRIGLVFTPDVGSAEAFSDGLRQVGITARSVSGASSDRESVIKQYCAGDFQVMCNCQILTKGFDYPRIAAIGLARPTQSGTLYRQMVGRGTRNYQDKENVMIVDWAWNSGKHDLVSPIELFDSAGMDAEVMEIADDLVKKGTEKDPLKAIEQAERIHKFRVASRVTVRERASKYRFIAFDPFEIAAVLGVPRRKSSGTPKKLSPYIQSRLKGFKIEPGGMGQGQAEKLIRTLDDRRRDKLATHRQVACLVANGVDQDLANTLSFDEASQRLDVLIGGRKTANA